MGTAVITLANPQNTSIKRANEQPFYRVKFFLPL